MSINLKWCNWIYLVGSVFMAVAVIGATFANMPGWFSEAVYQSAIYSLITFFVLAVLTNVLSRFVSNQIISLFFILVVLTAVAIPNLYINGAVFLGRENADFNTWHLLSLFTVHHQISATIFVVPVSVIICLLFWVVIKVRNSVT